MLPKILSKKILVLGEGVFQNQIMKSEAITEISGNSWLAVQISKLEANSFFFFFLTWILLTSFIPNYHDIIVTLIQDVTGSPHGDRSWAITFMSTKLVWLGIKEGVTHTVQSEAVIWSTILAARTIQAILESVKVPRKSTQQFHFHLCIDQKYDIQLEVHVSQIQSFLHCHLWKNYFPASSE